MPITRIAASNFKSFEHLDLRLGKFNVLLGANASGKSNFARIFEFLRDISQTGLENAVSLQGGVDFLRNLRYGSSRDLSIEVESDDKFSPRLISLRIGQASYRIAVTSTTYKLVIAFRKRRGGYSIAKEEIAVRGRLVREHRPTHKVLPRTDQQSVQEFPDPVSVSLTPSRKKVRTHIEGLPAGVRAAASGNWILGQITTSDKRTMLENPILSYDMPFPRETFARLGIYDFDPKLSKKATPLRGLAELETDGSNLAVVIRNILKNPKESKSFVNLVKDLLPFVDKMAIEGFADKSLLFKIRETYQRGRYLPAPLISDGTINIAALVVALYFSRRPSEYGREGYLPFLIFEEPERNIHPFLISKIMDLMKEAASQRQILISTHNPLVVKYAGLSNLLLVTRNKDGFSRVSRPENSDIIRTFLTEDLGIEDLFVKNLLV